jgi:hypothetical protein
MAVVFHWQMAQHLPFWAINGIVYNLKARHFIGRWLHYSTLKL